MDDLEEIMEELNSDSKGEGSSYDFFFHIEYETILTPQRSKTQLNCKFCSFNSFYFQSIKDHYYKTHGKYIKELDKQLDLEYNIFI